MFTNHEILANWLLIEKSFSGWPQRISDTLIEPVIRIIPSHSKFRSNE